MQAFASVTATSWAATPGAAIDRAHLESMTFGNDDLERELLGLFARQADLLLARLADADPVTAARLAHTLKGSALGIGASGVAAAASAIEAVTSEADRSVALDRLSDAIAQAQAAIATMLA